MQTNSYVIADYERRNFSVSQCQWDASATQDIVAILPPSNSSNSNTKAAGASSAHSLPITEIAGGAGGVAIIFIALLIMLFFLRRRRKARGLKLDDHPTKSANLNDETIIKAELDGHDHKAEVHENAHEIDGNDDRKWPAEISGHEVVELDSHGRKWPPGCEAVEIGPSGRTSPVYEMAAEEVAIEMSTIRNAKRKSERRPTSFAQWGESSPQEPVSASSVGRNRLGGYHPYRRDGTEAVSPVSRTFSPVSEGFSPI
jgi:hypothetical protein